MTFLELAESRYSVRKYADTPIEPEKMDAILKAGQIAPTGANRQPFHIYVLESPEALEKIRALSRCAFNAPAVLLIAKDNNTDWKSPLEPGFSAGEQDVSIAATHIMLEAWEQGIGTCWVNFFPNTETAKTFSLPENEYPILLMPMGYPAEGSVPGPMHAQTKALSELVTRL